MPDGLERPRLQQEVLLAPHERGLLHRMAEQMRLEGRRIYAEQLDEIVRRYDRAAEARDG